MERNTKEVNAGEMEYRQYMLEIYIIYITVKKFDV